jgi:hypothetical protein
MKQLKMVEDHWRKEAGLEPTGVSTLIWGSTKKALRKEGRIEEGEREKGKEDILPFDRKPPQEWVENLLIREPHEMVTEIRRRFEERVRKEVEKISITKGEGKEMLREEVVRKQEEKKRQAKKKAIGLAVRDVNKQLESLFSEKLKQEVPGWDWKKIVPFVCSVLAHSWFQDC